MKSKILIKFETRVCKGMKSRIYQQPLVGSYSNLKLKLMGSKQSAQRYEMKMTSNGRQHPTEDDKLENAFDVIYSRNN